MSLDNKCLTNKVVCKAEVKTNDGINELSTKVYFGISETEFKYRYKNHTMSFRNQTYENDTELLKYIWNVKDQNKDFHIKWSIFRYSIVSKSCNLYFLEKLVI